MDSPGGTGPPAAASDAEYFQTVEEHFVSRRGDPLVLSNADWFLVWKWRHRGIPLRVVLRGIDDALDAHEHSWSRDRRVGSLAYCAAEVDAAEDRWRRAVGSGRDDLPAAAEVLERAAAVLERATPRGAATAALIPPLVEALRERAARAARGPALDRWLQGKEGELVRAVLEDLGEPAACELREQASAALERFQQRLPQRVLEQVIAEGVARRALVEAGLPRLSLFEDA